MAVIDLEAIRKRDAVWKDDGRAALQAQRDRRELLRLVDELEQYAEDIAYDLKRIRALQEYYQPKPQTPEEAQAFLDEQTRESTRRSQEKQNAKRRHGTPR